jgi:predicted TIM-barrel fold metal-dependent hydrolase
MMQSHGKIWADIQKTYGQPQPENHGVTVSKFIFHKMDVENYFKGAPPYHDFWDVQVPLMVQFLEQNPDKLIGFVAFDPLRSDWKMLLDEKVGKERGQFWGVKYYPPMGYRPIQNEGIKDKTGDDLDAIMRAFFTYCKDRDIPIFAHCTPTGFEAIVGGTKNIGSGINANPKYWIELFKVHPELQELRLCLAHAGGQRGWFDYKSEDGLSDEVAEVRKDWLEYEDRVIELCQTCKNVYCDFAFLPDVSKPEDADKAREKLLASEAKRDANPISYPYSIFDKIMYGSDWHVLMNEAETHDNAYLGIYLDFFSHSELAIHADKFFYQNAERYLGINPPPII